MEKKQIKTGMLVETKEHGVYLCVGGTFINRKEWMSVDSYRDDLTDQQEGFNIVRVSKVLSGYLLKPKNWTAKTITKNLLWESKEDKPFGRPYVNTSNGIVAHFKSNEMAFGFDVRGGNWIPPINGFDLFDDAWQPFPQEKWDAMLLDYAKSRGYKNGNYECLFEPDDTAKINDNSFSIFGNDVWHDGKEKNNQIFDSQTGVWAQIIEPKEEMKDHFLDAAMYATGGNPSDVIKDGEIQFYFGIDFANVTGEPRYTTDEWIEIMKLGLERKKSEVC